MVLFFYKFDHVITLCYLSTRSSEGLTPLHIAAVWGCYQNLKLLLMNGGNPKTKDNVRIICINCLFKEKHSDIELQKKNPHVGKVNFRCVIFLYRMGTQQGNLQSKRRIGNALSFFKSIIATQETQKMMICLNSNTVRESLLPHFHQAVQYP